MTTITEENWKEAWLKLKDEKIDLTKHMDITGILDQDKVKFSLLKHAKNEIDFIQSLITSVKQEEREKCEKEFLKRTILHSTQVKIISLMKIKDITDLKLREIGKEVGEEHPQKIKHHISHLIKYGYINVISGRYQLSQSLTEEDVTNSK